MREYGSRIRFLLALGTCAYNHPTGEVWRGLRPLQTSPMVGVRGRLRRPRTPTIGMF